MNLKKANLITWSTPHTHIKSIFNVKPPHLYQICARKQQSTSRILKDTHDILFTHLNIYTKLNIYGQHN